MRYAASHPIESHFYLRPFLHDCLHKGAKTLYNTLCLYTLALMNSRKTFCALAAMVLLTGCSTTITNLTSSHVPRTADNLYPFEVALETSQASMKENSLQAFVLLGADVYPMRPVEMLKNRWETAVPIPASTNYVYYRYKFEYLYDRVGGPGKNSRLSTTYQLEIVDK